MPAHIILLSKYKMALAPVTLKCLNHNVEWDTQASNLMSNKGIEIIGCRQCRTENDRLKSQDFDERARLKDKNIVRLTDYVKLSSKIEVKCTKCDHMWMALPRDLLFKDSHCPKCTNHMSSGKTLTNEQFDIVSNLPAHIVRIGKYSGHRKKILLKCKIHNKSFKAYAGAICKKDYIAGCRKCFRKYHKNETKALVYLEQILPGVKISDQFKIKEQIYDKNGKLIRKYIIVDFLINLNNKDIIIEYNGPQHFKQVRRWGGKIGAKEKLRQQTVRDQFLRDYCLKHNMVLIEIDGRDFTNELIKGELERQLAPFM